MEVVLIVLAALVVLFLVWMLAKRQRERRLDARREEAGELRQTARQEAAEAETQAARAERVRERAQQRVRDADEVDPDIDTERSSQAERT
jgi:Tfp pilus assembly protein PilO